jgi:hypothetical protein
MRLRYLRGLAALAALATALAERPARAEDDPPDPDNTMIVTGRLQGADGKPIAGGEVALVAEVWCRSERPLGMHLHCGLPITFRVTGPFRSDGQGGFRATAAVGPARPAHRVVVHAAAAGHGHVTVNVIRAARSQDIVIKLDREHVVRGRLIDTQGQPAAGATVRPIMFSIMGTTRETLISTEPVPPYALPLAPAVTTDDKGRFLIKGLGKEKFELEVTHERFATERLAPAPAPLANAKDTPFSLIAARLVEGRVTYSQNGRPATGARVIAHTGFDGVVQCVTDQDGRYSLNPLPGDSFTLRVFPSDGEPYLVAVKGLTFSQSARLDADVILERGVLVRGRVTETPSGKPVSGALVLYRPHWRNNPYNNGKYNFTAYNSDWVQSAQHTATSDSDGAFRLAVPPGPGDLFVLGPTLDYVHVASSIGDLEFGRPSRVRVYPDALVPLDLKPQDETHAVTAVLHRGVTLRARVEGPDGAPIKSLLLLSRSYTPTNFEHYQQVWDYLEARDGELALPGCDPEKGGSALLFDRDHACGLVLKFTGAEAAGPARTVRLEPCGSARVRCVDKQGKPVANLRFTACVVLAPGSLFAASVLSPKDDKELEGDWGFWMNYHFKRAWEPETNAQGYTTFSGLVPGATYWITAWDRGDFDFKTGNQREEFRVKAGETLELPDYVVKR